MSIKIVNELAEENWRAFVEGHPQSNIFHTPEMFQVFSSAKGYIPKLWAAVNQQKQIQALLLPVDVTLIDGLMRRLTTRSVVYGGLLVLPGEGGQKALSILLETYIQRVKDHTLFTELRHLSDASHLRPILRRHGFVGEAHLNYLIDLSRPAEDILQSIGKRTRKKIRRGLRTGTVVIESVTSIRQLSQWYKIIEETYHNAAVPLADRSMFEAAFDILQPKGMALFLMGRVGSEYIVASLELPYKGVIYGWYGGVKKNYGKYYPNEMLMWHVLQWGVEHGYETYDFGGAGHPDQEYGVRDFKAKFNGQLINFGRDTCVHAPLALKLGKLGYTFYRNYLLQFVRPHHPARFV